MYSNQATEPKQQMLKNTHKDKLINQLPAYTDYASFNPRLVQVIAKLDALFWLVLGYLHGNINARFPSLQLQ